MTLSVEIRHRLAGFELDLSFETPPGLTVLFGRSGSGKTTVVNAVAGLLRPDHGRIRIDEKTLQDTTTGIWLPPQKRRLGYVFQEARLFPHLTVSQNLGYGRWFASKNSAGEDFDKVVDMLGIRQILPRRPANLSGGERQRVAIGRALLAKPQLILADEPLAALDEARKAEILPYFERLRDETSVPILYVSHSAAEVARLATTVVVLQNGKLIRQGPAAEVLSDPSVTPLGARAAGAILQAKVYAHHPDGLTELSSAGERLFLPHVPHEIGRDLRIRIAAQEVIVARQRPEGLSALNILPGTVEQIRAGDGPGTIVSIRTNAGLILARVTQRSAKALELAPGAECYAIIKSVAVAPQDIGTPG